MHKEIPFFNLEHQHTEIQFDLSEAISRVMRSNSFILGESLASFEKQYASFNGVAHCAGVGNGLDAIYLSLKALGVGKGDEVIVPSNTYIATWLAVEMAGATIVPVEPNPATYTIDVTKIEAAITPRTSCIIPVHLFGQPCEMEELMALAARYSLFVIEDNAQAHGAIFNAKRTGSFGHINATSFYPTKNLGALGDGGAITTNDPGLYEQICVLRNYGSAIKYFNEVLGVNSRLDEIQASVLSVKLKYLEKWNRERQRIANIYCAHLNGIGDLIFPRIAEKAIPVFHVFTIRTKYRDDLQKHLLTKGIHTMIHYPVPPHLQKAFAHLNFALRDFPIAEELSTTSLSLPIWPGLDQDDVRHITHTISEFFSDHL